MNQMRNIDVVYSLINLCTMIGNCYGNCGDDFDAFIHKRYCDDTVLFPKTLMEIRMLLDILTPEFCRLYSKPNFSIQSLKQMLKTIFEYEGAELPGNWHKLKINIEGLKVSCEKIVNEYRVYIQSSFLDDLQIISYQFK